MNRHHLKGGELFEQQCTAYTAALECSTEARKLKEKSKAVWSRKLPHTALWNDANELAAST